jgi:hypothetical protein
MHRVLSDEDGSVVTARSNRQPSPTLEPPPFQHLATAPGGLAGKEAVFA